MNFSTRGQGVVKWILYGIIILAAIMVAISVTSGFIMDYYWFKSVGYLQVFMTNIKCRLVLLFIGWAVTTSCLLLSWRTIRKSLGGELPDIGSTFFKVFSVFMGLGVGWWFKDGYLTFLKFLNRTSWGVTDPLALPFFHNDISFYVFTLPMLRTVLTFVAAVSGIVLVLSLFVYGLGRAAIGPRPEGEITPSPSPETPGWRFARFLRSWPVLGSIVALTAVGAILTWLGRFSYLWEFHPGASVPTGASYMAVHYLIPYTWVKAFGVILFGYLIFRIFSSAGELREKVEFGGLRELKTEALILAAVILIFLIIPGAVFGAINRLNVEPNEPGIQKNYVNRCIEATNRAYGLENVPSVTYSSTGGELSAEKALKSPTVKNARVIDYRPVKQTYRQKQRLRTYYEFPEIDVGRYRIEGEKKLAVISGREMSKKAGGWQNEHLYFTHGFGAVASPASRAAPDGSPILKIRNIPPTSWGNLSVDPRPRIYYGEKTNSYAIVRANGLDEFDYPKGENNASYRYEYDSGIPIGNPWKKLISWFYTGDFKILVSNYVGENSRLLLHRNVHERVKKIAPFLRYDPDAHLFAGNNGGLIYQLNGITRAERYPYSYTGSGAPGYLSDSVKAFVKANTGEAAFYITQDGDPVAKTFSKIYPSLFKKGEEMPQYYRKHLIYPESLFQVQMKIYRRYHMRGFRAFYQKEDLWTPAGEKYHGRGTRVEPYNILLNVENKPGFENRKKEFTLIKPFTPKGKKNMRALVLVGQDPGNYGQITVIKFPKGELFRGPRQVEAIISQNTHISRRVSLWEGAGSNVLRGNLLVLPVENSLIYIEPLYLSGAGVPYPQLKRVIAVRKDRAAMENSLRRAVSKVLKGRVGRARPPENIAPGENLAPAKLVQAVRKYLNLRENYIRLHRQGDYVSAAKIKERMAQVVENMKDLSRGG